MVPSTAELANKAVSNGTESARYENSLVGVICHVYAGLMESGGQLAWVLPRKSCARILKLVVTAHGWALLLQPHKVPPAIAYRLRRVLSRLPPRAPEPYSTHVPILIGLSRQVTIRRVLELGSGRYSTLTFLDRDAFPDVVRVDSLETDRLWLSELRELTSADSRVRMHLVERPMASAVARIELNEYDLIFVDDSTDELSRATTIANVAARAGRCAIVVIHDYEIGSYRRAARGLPHHYAFTALNPNTGVCWSDARLSRSGLRALNRLVKRHVERLAPHDRKTWTALIDAGLG